MPEPVFWMIDWEEIRTNYRPPEFRLPIGDRKTCVSLLKSIGQYYRETHPELAKTQPLNINLKTLSW